MNIDMLLASDGVRSIPTLDAQLLLAYVLGLSRIQLLTWPLQPVSVDQIADFQALVKRRAQGEPLAYLLGHKEFWSLNLRVNPAVLVPRPETECLVSAILARFQAADPYPRRVLDLGTGSGPIALALASERPHWQIYAVDRSIAALTVAKSNASALGLERIRFVVSDWLEAFVPTPISPFDIIVSNPPYIEEGDPHLRQEGLCYEPQEALVGGADGLRDLRKIIGAASAFLKAGGCLALEHGYTQGVAVRSLMQNQGFTGEITLKDDAGLDRLSLAYR